MMVQMRRGLRRCICKVLKIPEWHVTQSTKRPYAVFIIRKINEMIEKSEITGGKIIEVGCGMGDIISSIKYRDKSGYDLDKRVIWGGRIIHPGKALFRTGTFDDISNEDIAVLIMVNFLHDFDDEYCRKKLDVFFKNNRVSRIVVDSAQMGYFHDYEKLLGDFGYMLEYRSRGFGIERNVRRRILFFRIK